MKNLSGNTIQDRIIRLPQLVQRSGLARSTIYDRMNPKSPRYDETFPKKLNLGGSAVGWLESEVEQWLSSWAQQRS
ncbi:MAG: AlpA family phage regulatory protein [Moraxellaceae bacterium]|nr:MAG: AlpA family phage regulatory protein [Moraxellaceae bacterium]